MCFGGNHLPRGTHCTGSRYPHLAYFFDISSVFLWCIKCISLMNQVFISDVSSVFLWNIKWISLMNQVYFSDVSSVYLWCVKCISLMCINEFLQCISWVTVLRTWGVGCGGNHLVRGTHYTRSRYPHKFISPMHQVYFSDTSDVFLWCVWSVFLQYISWVTILRIGGVEGGRLWWEPFSKRHSLYRVTLHTFSVFPMYQVFFSGKSNVFFSCVTSVFI